MSHQITNDKWLQPNEQKALAQTIRICRLTDTRNALLVELALKCGARASELLLITRRDLNVAFKTVHIRGLKGSHDRDVALNADLFKRLHAYAESIGADSLLFPISYKRLDQVWQGYRPNSKKFHALRHTFAIELYQKTRDILKVKRALGHKSLSNTMVYLEVQYSAEDVARDAL